MPLASLPSVFQGSSILIYPYLDDGNGSVSALLSMVKSNHGDILPVALINGYNSVNSSLVCSNGEPLITISSSHGGILNYA